MKILSILCLFVILNGCFGLGALTFQPVEHETEIFSISDEKNEFADDDNPPRLTKEILISTRGKPDEISADGKCEVVTYYDGYVWTGVYVQLAFFPIPLLAPTEHDENRFYFVNDESVALVTHRGRLTKCSGVILAPIPNSKGIDCGKINRKAPKSRSANVKWCDENLQLSWAEHRDALAGYQLYHSGSSRIERLKGLCRSAVSGYAFGQAEVGRIYRWGLEGVKQDSGKAYLWYSRANQQNPSMWQDELDELLRKAPSVEKLPSSKDAIAERQDVQCERDLVPKSSPH